MENPRAILTSPHVLEDDSPEVRLVVPPLPPEEDPAVTVTPSPVPLSLEAPCQCPNA